MDAFPLAAAALSREHDNIVGCAFRSSAEKQRSWRERAPNDKLDYE